MDHVGSRRLFELAQMPTIISEPEWEHIKDCSDCGRAFIVLSGAFGQIEGPKHLLAPTVPLT
jgi:hypothetical protein